MQQILQYLLLPGVCHLLFYRSILLPNVDLNKQDIMMTFTCGTVKNSIPQKERVAFSMKIVEGPKSNQLKLEISKGQHATVKSLALATVRISVEELLEKSASIDQQFPLETHQDTTAESKIRMSIAAEKLRVYTQSTSQTQTQNEGLTHVTTTQYFTKSNINPVDELDPIFEIPVKSTSQPTHEMELQATKANVSADGRFDALTKVMAAKDDEVTALHHKVTVLQDRLKYDLTTPQQFKHGEKDRLRQELKISDKYLEKTVSELDVENELLRTKLTTASKVTDENTLLKRTFDEAKNERKLQQLDVEKAVNEIQKEKSNLNDLLNIAGEEKKSKMILLEQESYAHTKTRGIYSDEKTKNQDLKASISRMEADICNQDDLKVQCKEQQRKVHEEKVKQAELNNQKISMIHKFESDMLVKNKEMDDVKGELGKTINVLTSAECKIRDLTINLDNSKDSLGKASLNITRLSENLKDEHTRYGKLLEDARKDRNVLQISYETKIDKLRSDFDTSNAKYEEQAKRSFAEYNLDLANLRTNNIVEMKSVRDDHEQKFKDNHDIHSQQTDSQRKKYDEVVKKHEDDLENRKTKYLGDLLNQKDGHDKAYNNLQKDHVIANQLSRNEHENAMNQLRNNYEQVVSKLEATLELVNANHIREMQGLNIAHEAKVMKLIDGHNNKSNTLISDHDLLEKKLKQQHNGGQLKLRNDTDFEISNLNKNHETERSKLLKEHADALIRSKADYDARVKNFTHECNIKTQLLQTDNENSRKKLMVDHESAENKLNNDCLTKTNKLKTDHESDRKKLNEAYDKLKADFENKIYKLNAEHESDRKKLIEACDKLKADQENKLSYLKAEHETDIMKRSENQDKFRIDSETTRKRLVDDHSKAIQKLDIDYNTKNNKIRSDHEAWRAKLLDDHKSELEKINSYNTSYQDKLKVDHQDKENKLFNDCEVKTKQQKEGNENKEKKLRNDHDEVINNMKNDHASRQSLLRDNFNSESSLLKDNHSSEIKSIKEDHSIYISGLNSEHESTVINQVSERGLLKENHQNQLKNQNSSHSGELFRQNQQYTEKISKDQVFHDSTTYKLKDEHETNIIKKLKLFQTTKDDHSTETNKRKVDNDVQYTQFKIVQEALLKKNQVETTKDKSKLFEMNESAKQSLTSKLESVSGKQQLTEKGFEALREKLAQKTKEYADLDFQLRQANNENQLLKNDMRIQYEKFNEVTKEKEKERQNFQQERIKSSQLSNNICTLAENVAQEKNHVKVRDEKLVCLDDERAQKLNFNERLMQSENGRLKINDTLKDVTLEFDDHRKDWNQSSREKDKIKLDLENVVDERNSEIHKWNLENSALQKDNGMLAMRVEEWKIKHDTKIDVELMRDTETKLANEHQKAKYEIIAELYKLADGYELMSRHYLESAKEVVKLQEENKNCKVVIVELRSKVSVQIPVKDDPLDCKLAEYLNSRIGRLDISFVRESPGQQFFGSKKVFLKQEQGYLVVRVGGGYLNIEEFIETYTTVELEKLLLGMDSSGKPLIKSSSNRTQSPGRSNSPSRLAKSSSRTMLSKKPELSIKN